MRATEPSTAPRAPLRPVAAIAASAHVPHAAANLRTRESQLQARADVIRRELALPLGDAGMQLTHWELDGLCLAMASESVIAQDVVLRLAALRMHLEEQALGDPDAVDNILSQEDGHGPVF